MIKNHRDEELCRRCYALSDEDHTHHVWPHKNSLSKRGMVCFVLIETGDPQVPTYGHRVLLLHGGIGKVHGGLLIFVEVTMEMHQVLTERGDLLNPIFGDSSGQDFLESNYFVTDGSFSLTAVYCDRRGCHHNTSNDPFSRCKSVQQMAAGQNWRSHNTVWHKSGLKVRIQQLVCYACGVTMHDTDTNDDMTTMTVVHTEHINTNIWVCFVSFILCQRIVIHCTCAAWLKSWILCSLVIPIHMHSWCVRFSLSFSFTSHLTHLLSHSFHFFTHLKFVDNLRIPPKKSMDSFDETCSNTTWTRDKFYADRKTEEKKKNVAKNLASSRVSKSQVQKMDACVAKYAISDLLRRRKSPARSHRMVERMESWNIS